MTSDEHLNDTPYRINVDNIHEIEHIPADISPENLEFLRKLIDSFNISTSRLKESYATLQGKVENLNLKLEETNRDLSKSLVEQERLSNYLTNILESLLSGVLVIDTDGIITLFNRGAESMTGIAEEEALNKPYREVMGYDVPEKFTPLWTLSSEEEYTQFEKIITSKDGKIIPIGCSISPLKNSSGEKIGAVEIFMDLTRIKVLEDELSHKEKLAVLGQMAATMAHKIRNPLGGITGFTGLLELELKDNENCRRMLSRIIEGAEKLNKIITSLISYASQIELKPQKIDLGLLMKEIVATIKGKNNATVQFSIEQPEEPVIVTIDVRHYRQAVTNIIRNALEAIAGEEMVKIVVIPGTTDYKPCDSITTRLLTVICESSSLMKSRIPGGIILITDSGHGMSSIVREQLFVPFFTTKEDGIGLGLASAKKIIEAHHGEIWIESKENQGTVVGIVLPRESILLSEVSFK